MANPKFFYDNRFADGTPAASSTAAGDFDVLNLREWRPFKWWKPNALPATVTVDCAAPAAADSLCIWGHTLYTGTCTVEVRGSTDNFSASDVLVHSYTPGSNAPFVRSFNSVSYRYWRLRITGSSVQPIAICAIGTVLTAPVPLDEGFDPIGRKIQGNTNRSQAGHPLGRVIDFEEWSENLRFPWVTWSWLRATWEPAWDAHLGRNPFVFAWDTDNYPAELRLVMVKDAFKSPHKAGSYATLDLDVMGVYP